ncbi:hypothetical protein MTO96_048496, partial [Rhipicephalus appendiculatus]
TLPQTEHSAPVKRVRRSLGIVLEAESSGQLQERLLLYLAQAISWFSQKRSGEDAEDLL